jgi:hypothetical protein
LEKVSATLITAASVVIFFYALRRLTRERIAWGIAIVYAFGTSSFSMSSQALFQHGPSQLFLSLMLYCLMRGLEEPRWSAYAGFALAGAIICRPVDALIGLPIGAYMLQKRRAQLIRFLLASLPPFLLFMAYNMQYFGAPLTTGFAAAVISPSSFWGASSYILSTPLLKGLMGILVSPGRGLLIYSPIFVLSLAGIVMIWRESGYVLLKYLSLSVVFLLILAAKYVNWWGGHSYGPRLLADITPILCLFLYPAFEWSEMRRFPKFAFIGLCGLSVSIHAVGAFSDGSWNYTPINVDQAPERLWSWVDSPPVYYVREMVNEARQAFAHLKWILLDIPTSLEAPQQLAASYNLISPVPGPTVDLNQSLTLRITAHNLGETVWLAVQRMKEGPCARSWHWSAEDQAMATSWGGKVSLKYDILRRNRYTFAAKIVPPQGPGGLSLKIGLIRD